MKAKFKVVGANKTTQHLMNKEGLMTKSYQQDGTILREIVFDNKIHLFDEKNVDFLSHSVVTCGWLSDETAKVGRIALKFIPENE